jgi:hypothetical protein
MKMKSIMVVVVGVVMLAGAAEAAPLKGVQAWAAQVNAGAAAQELARLGVTNEAVQAAVMATWEEEALIDAAVASRAYALVHWAMLKSPFSRGGMQRVKAALLAEGSPPSLAVDIVQRYPLEERGEFAAVLDAAMPIRFPNNPAFGRFYVDQVVLRGLACYGPEVPEAEQVKALLAGEAMTLEGARRLKDGVKQRATKLARLQLRAEGKSFVTPTNGVNPLTERVAPVVVALNAPACEGLEAALRKLGSSMADVERAALLARVAEWRTAILAGEKNGEDIERVLGKLAVGLGVEAYNRFVDEYNNGAGGGE